MTVPPLTGLSHACFGLSYLLALGLEIARLFWPGRGWRLAGLAAGAAGVLAHTAYLALNPPTPAAPYGSLLLLAWVLALFYLYGTLHYARQAWAVFVLPLVLGLVGLSLALAASDTTAAPDWLHGDRFWGAVHGFLLLGGAIGISVGFLASVMYLVQLRRVRNRVNPAVVVPMLNLERLEAMARNAVNWAFPLLTAGLLVGTLLLRTGHGGAETWLSLKVLTTASLWLVFAVLVYLRYATNVSARRLATLHVAAFGLLLLALMASHPFAGGDR
ncbi:cytochrome c biogenesis protein CcsA [Urbifossiella limnaea]|uniref:Cytochrome C assembly protein n=1 Tax=Urbifossiella limnaea TaxID=2528023 RepID=A0A517Y072_9BACT|nr:cytochrome c biogenesis protein CcsA [Urbifossiella limnaea]QDU23166.1 Cytochrome C assembly protein [Urbifossiella limnaea]